MWRPGSKGFISCPHQQHLRHFFLFGSNFFRLKLNRFQRFLFQIVHTAKTASYLDMVQVSPNQGVLLLYPPQSISLRKTL